MSHLSQLPAVTRARSAAIRSGALAALGTWAVVVLPALVGWLAAPEGSLGWFSAVQVGSAVWFLGHGQSIGGEAISISLTPVALFLVFVYVAVRWARRLVAIQRAAVIRLEWSRTAKLGVIPGFVIGYVGAGAVISLLTLGGTVAPGFAAVPGTALVPLVALGVLLLRPADPHSPGFVRAWFRRGPTWLPTAWHLGWRGAGLLFLVGLGLVLVRLGLGAGEVMHIHGQYGLNLAASGVLALAEALFLGNAATWALAFVAGPGFSVAAGSVIGPAASEPGLMPLVPILGALPAEADYPPAMFVVLLLPVAVGVIIGRWVDRDLEFFGNLSARLFATLTAAVIPAGAVGLLTWLGNGSLGVERLADVGPSVLPVTGALLLEVALGALAWAGWRAWRTRSPLPEEDTRDEAADTADSPADEAQTAEAGPAAYGTS